MAQINDFTNGAPFLVTLVEDVEERSRHIHYLLPNGSRRRVTIDVSEDSPETRQKLGESLAGNNYKRGRKPWRRSTS